MQRAYTVQGLYQRSKWDAPKKTWLEIGNTTWLKKMVASYSGGRQMAALMALDDSSAIIP